MGERRVALLILVAACSAKSPPPLTGGPAERPRAGDGSAALAPAAASGSGAAAADAGVTAPSAPASTATLAEVGIEAASLDRSVDPCVDFYQFACGGWLQANQIPADRARWSRLGEIDERIQQTLRTTLEAAAKRPGDKLGDYYASCMDEVTIALKGTEAIKPLLAKTRGVKNAKTWFAALTALHKTGIWPVWAATAEAGLADATRYVTWLDSSGLGLPDRDYYVTPDRATTLAGYREHVGRMLGHAGIAKPDAAAGDVVAIETALAKVTKTAVEKRDVAAMNNPRDLKALARQTKSVDWKAYFKALGVTPSPTLLVTSPAYFAAIDGVRKQFKPAQWASYFTYHLLAATASALPHAFEAEAFALEQLVSGTAEQEPRHERCIRSVAHSLGELLGKQYVAEHFPPAAKQAAQTLFGAITKAMGDEIGQLDWMAEATKQIARTKLGKLVAMIGYPDTWRSYDVVVKRDDFAGNLVRASAFETRRKLAKAGKPYDRGEWHANAFEVNANYNFSANNTAILAGILQPPFFGADRAIAANLGGIGLVVGHELTHGFDDQGAQFDAAGNLVDWWSTDDKTKFQAKARCVAEQYATFEVLPKQFVNGKLTLGENIADLGGVKMAYRAYRSLRTGATPIVADGFSEDQVFFLAAAQIQCTKDRPAETARRLTVDPHAPPKFRVYGQLRNLPEFAQAFSCAAGTPMRPATTCSVW